MKSKKEEIQSNFNEIAEIKTIKTKDKRIYNIILQEGLKGVEEDNIQFFIKAKDTFGIASLKSLTEDDIENINFEELNFTPAKKVLCNKKNHKKNQNLSDIS